MSQYINKNGVPLTPPPPPPPTTTTSDEGQNGPNNLPTGNLPPTAASAQVKDTERTAYEKNQPRAVAKILSTGL